MFTIDGYVPIVPGTTFFEEVVALSVFLGALAGIWKFGGGTVIRGVWAAIVAAPKIPEALENLGEIVRTDVVTQLRAMIDHSKNVDDTLLDHEGRISRLEDVGGGGGA